MSVANPSRLEVVRDILVAAYQGITVANGYRQTIVKVDGSYLDPRTTPTFPIIQVYFGDMKTEELDSAWSTANIKTTVYAVGQVKGTSAKLSTNAEISDRQNKVYQMQSDLIVKTASLAKSYVNDTSNSFVIDFVSQPVRIFAVPDFANQDVVSVFCTFGIILRNVDLTTLA